MSQFPHLNLAHKLYGNYKFPAGGSSKKNLRILENLKKRDHHGIFLKGQIAHLQRTWDDQIKLRKENGLPEMISGDIKPIFLQVDCDSFTIESLRHWGIEVLSEQDDGYIIGVSTDNFKSLEQKIEQFLNNKGRYKNTAAKLFTINEGIAWRLEEILTPGLSAKWDTIVENDEYMVYAGIACNVFIKDYPNKNDLSDEEFATQVSIWEAERNRALEYRDEISLTRFDEFERLVAAYEGGLLTSFIDFNDSYYVSFRIIGKGLKDIALHYQYLFELGELDSYNIPIGEEGDLVEINPELIAPDPDDPKICVIDSGIQEGHKLLQLAIDSARSLSFVTRDSEVNDKVAGGGHGTRVAGAILYGDNIPREGRYKLPFWLHNARVLDDNNSLSCADTSNLMMEICDKFADSRIFNLSIANENGFLGSHMPPWAATIDKISYEQDKLFVIAAGNVSTSSENPAFQGIKEIIASGLTYPDFLHSVVSNKVSDPGISAFGITVGSVCLGEYDDADKKSFGKKNFPSSFSRTGLGLWGMIKPDVVEYGGDFVHEKLGDRLISNEGSISPELVCSTRDGGSAVGRNIVGTSFAAPKVTHIAGWLEKNFPQLNTNSYRALIIQSARLPEDKWKHPTLLDIRHFGYGIPSLERASQNRMNRITFLSEGYVSPKAADIFMVKVPKQVNRPGLDNEILIEITISYKVPIRRTRKYTKSYLASWLTWEISNPLENHQQFCARVIKSMDDKQTTNNRDALPWMIWDRGNNGIIKDIKRQDSTLQKDWTIIRSNQLPDEFSVAVVGHVGWDKDLKSKIPYSIVVSFESLNEEIPVYQLFEIENKIAVEQEQLIKQEQQIEI